MNWMRESFDQYTIAWVLIASTIGGIVGASVKFVFENLLGPKVTSRREARRLLDLYTAPILRSAEALERQVNNFVRNAAKGSYGESEYYHLSTLYTFGDFLGWVKIIERDFGFVPYESTNRGRDFTHHLYGPFKALTSFAYFKWSDDEAAIEASLVPRHMLRAIGEAMTSGVPERHVKEFTQFLYSYANDPTFVRWFQELDEFLLGAERGDRMRMDRLVATGANLRAFIVFLDPKGKSVDRRRIANVDRAHPQVRAMLKTEFGGLLENNDDRQASG
jgi:hypothetical protein